VLPLLRGEGQRRRRAGLLHRSAGRRRGPARCGGVGNGRCDSGDVGFGWVGGGWCLSQLGSCSLLLTGLVD
jgi:hypothetical protein